MELKGKFVAKLGEEFIPLVRQRSGETADEAIANCLEAARKSVYCEMVINDEVAVPHLDILNGKCPKEVPDGFVLVITAQCRHKALNPYQVRYIAVPHASKINEGIPGFEKIVTELVKVEFRDISPEAIRAFFHSPGEENYCQHVALPERSLEYVKEKWVESARKIYAVSY